MVEHIVWYKGNTCFVTHVLPIVILSNFEINIYNNLTCGMHIVESHKHDIAKSHEPQISITIARSTDRMMVSNIVLVQIIILYVHNKMALKSKHT